MSMFSWMARSASVIVNSSSIYNIMLCSCSAVSLSRDIWSIPEHKNDEKLSNSLSLIIIMILILSLGVYDGLCAS